MHAGERPNEETVHALLETVRELLRAEEARATSLNPRGSGLAGFVAIIVSLREPWVETFCRPVWRLSREW